MRKIKILVACGSGVATSTLASKTVEEVCKKVGVEADINTCSIRSVGEESKSYDIVLTTSKYDKELTCPVMSVTSFITGIQLAKTKNELGNKLLEIASNN